MSWVDNLLKKVEEIEARLAAEVEKQEAANVEHNARIDAEIAELDHIVNSELVPGVPIAQAHQAVLRSQIRLLRMQWERERK